MNTAENRGPQKIYRRIAFYSCVLFGIAMIVNTQLAYDGGWYWYAWLVQSGRHLYSDWHVVFQPFLVLQNEAWLLLAGKGWLLSRIPAVLYLAAFVAGISSLATKSGWSDAQKAVLLAGAFFVGIHFEAYRFDDYHVISDVCYLFAIYLLLVLDKKAKDKDSSRQPLAIAAALGVLTGITITNRITDGAGLFVCTFLAIAYLARSRRGVLLVAFCGLALLTSLGLISLTGDSLSAYVSSTILHAAGPKGGAPHVLVRPFLLAWNSLRYLGGWRPLMVILLSGVIVASWTVLLRPYFQSGVRKPALKVLLGFLVICGSLYLLVPYLGRGRIIVDVSALLVLAFYGLFFVVFYRILRVLMRGDWTSATTRTEIVVFIPFALLLAGSLSSGGLHFGLYDPIALLLLISPIIFPAVFNRGWVRSSFLVLVTLMGVSGAWAKVVDPASWQSYRTFPMFTHRLLVHHPVYGPMVIDDELHHFIERTCAIVKTQSNPDLLSIPLPYANYYCAIPPWEGFVQTFFDTAGKDVIDSMMTKLDASPPTWVLYQRQLDMLLGHEVLYNGGKRLPQRDLDDFIVRKVRSGQWVVMDRAPYLGDQWVLIKTHQQ